MWLMFAQPQAGEKARMMKQHELRMNANNAQRPMPAGLNLSAEQKEAFKNSMIALQKDLKPLRNKLGEAMAHQRTLMSDDNPDMKAINKNIDAIGNLKTEMAKLQAKHRIDMRAQLNDEQKLKFDMFVGQQKHKRGMAHGKDAKIRHQQAPKMH